MIFRSPSADIAIPDTALTPFVLRHAARLADKPALIDDITGRTLTFGQLAEAIDRTAAGLAERGFRKGDVFAIYAANCLEYAVAFHAVASCGGIVTTINPAYTAAELAHQLADAGATSLLTTPDLLEKARSAALQAGVPEVFVFGEAAGATPFASLQSSGTPPSVALDPGNDLVALPYSSGTTGLPKGVMLTHTNLVANVAQVAACGLVTEEDTLIGVLPFFHIYGLTVLMNISLAVGATVVVLPRYDLESFLQTLETYVVTFACIVPPIVLALAKQAVVDDYDLTRLRTVVSGAAPLGADISHACRERIGCHVKQGYGLTEASPVTHLSPMDPDRIAIGSVGHLLPNTEARIVDAASGIEAGPGEQGEIWIRGPQVMKGYRNRPDATAAMLDADKWLHTGDIGCVDAAGNFFVVDRLKELIKYKAYQVAPAELEAILLSHPAVADVAVVPSPDEDAGEVPKAFVVLASVATPDELMAFVAERVAPFKKVRRIEYIDQIPKSATGKILRRVLVERERAAAAVPVPVPV
jgi:acyl-CoA synthetase (AMP-forming)/AMP-acid ligase II